MSLAKAKHGHTSKGRRIEEELKSKTTTNTHSKTHSPTHTKTQKILCKTGWEKKKKCWNDTNLLLSLNSCMSITANSKRPPVSARSQNTTGVVTKEGFTSSKLFHFIKVWGQMPSCVKHGFELMQSAHSVHPKSFRCVILHHTLYFPPGAAKHVAQLTWQILFGFPYLFSTDSAC